MTEIEQLRAENKRALWQLMRFHIHRYLMSNTQGRLDGFEKAQRHLELSEIYVKVRLGLGWDYGLEDRDDMYDIQMKVHDATQAMTSHMDTAIGFPVFDNRPDYDDLAPKFFEKFLELADAEMAQ
jgi:hypothetical protein